MKCWFRGKIQSTGEVAVQRWWLMSSRNFSADVISRASFGSSFSEGKEIFNKIRQLQVAMAKQDTYQQSATERFGGSAQASATSPWTSGGSTTKNTIPRRHHLRATATASCVPSLRAPRPPDLPAGRARPSTSSWTTARDDVHHCRLVPDAPRRAPGVAVPRARRGHGRRSPGRAPGRGHDPEAEDGDDGGSGDAPAVPAGAVRDAGGPARPAPRRARRPERHRRPGPRGAGAPRPRRLGARPRQVRPEPVRQWRRGSLQAATHVHALRRRRAHLRRAEPRRGGGQGRAGAPAAQVRARAVAGFVHRPAFRLTVDPGSGVALILKKLYPAD
uniref:Uncharacterized protein n=1 Tax=Setaria viridis TaxID=4556 RepID=A0A4U6TE26_SETVI|nr:hypothetical protein SEVIR_8G002525v2 [Setaria viridis]TKV98867.1 hypothetical protein SEVIR_8G002525v2 [Setaria viridis]TKV98868.1 hypothetical protein SEVIR_8G002525v2 [Setaria viridis]TKV98869.1 hypothetical protein SEVIR_8G002525v2 [Setaria viridis]TKV98870.1 hypothetical protein SEVIR_8G002525v2 [Setaria viridis]